MCSKEQLKAIRITINCQKWLHGDQLLSKATLYSRVSIVCSSVCNAFSKHHNTSVIKHCHCQASSSIIKHHQALSTVIKRHQVSRLKMFIKLNKHCFAAILHTAFCWSRSGVWSRFCDFPTFPLICIFFCILVAVASNMNGYCYQMISVN